MSICTNTSFTVVGNFRDRPSVRSNGVKMDGTRPTEPDGTESVGTEPKLRGDGTEIMWGRNQNYVGPIPLYFNFMWDGTEIIFAL